MLSLKQSVATRLTGCSQRDTDPVDISLFKDTKVSLTLTSTH